MADERISDLSTITDISGTDLLLIIKDRVGQTKVSHKISLNEFFESIPANTTFAGDLTVEGNVYLEGDNLSISSNTNITGNMIVKSLEISSNGIIINNKLTPANNSVPAIDVGKFFYDENYLYVKVAEDTIKRVALSSF